MRLLGALIAAVIVIAVVLWPRKLPPAPAPASASVSHASAVRQAVLLKRADIAGKRSLPSDNKDPNPAAVRQLTRLAHDALIAGKYYNAFSRRREVFERLARDPNELFWLKRSLLEPGWARRTFGDEQALIRVMAINVLEHPAQQGETKELLGVIHGFSQAESGRLEQWLTEKGSVQDFKDLVYALIKTTKPQELKGGLDGVLQDLDFVAVSDSRVRSLIYGEFFQYLSPIFTHETEVILSQMHVGDQVAVKGVR